MTDPDERAERAFRTALSRAADGYEPDELTPSSRRRRRTWPAVAAAAVLVAGTVTGVTLWSRGDRVQEAGPAPTSGATSASTGSLPAPASGWHYESYRDVVVQVPDSWGYAHAPSGAWCTYQRSDLRRVPPGPYVATNGPYEFDDLVGCAGVDPHDPLDVGVPRWVWATHVSFAPRAAEPDTEIGTGQRSADDWTLMSRDVGHAHIAVLAEPPYLDDAHRILDSATVVSQDQLGCASASRVQQGHFVRPVPAFDVAAVSAVDSISVCFYDLAVPPDQPGLIASRSLTGTHAGDELAAIRAGRAGGGPDTPDTCVHDMYGDTAIVLRLTTESTVQELYTYYDWCFGNGFDDGTQRRELTTASCPPLWGGRVVTSGGSMAPFERCHPEAAAH